MEMANDQAEVFGKVYIEYEVASTLASNMETYH